MTIERRNPIPPGVYWHDVPNTPRSRVGWQSWLIEHTGDVRQLTTEERPEYIWVLFEVVRSVPRWTPDTGLGLPTIAPHGKQTSKDDTVQRPPPETPGGIISDLASSLVPIAIIAVILIAINQGRK